MEVALNHYDVVQEECHGARGGERETWKGWPESSRYRIGDVDCPRRLEVVKESRSRIVSGTIEMSRCRSPDIEATWSSCYEINEETRRDSLLTTAPGLVTLDNIMALGYGHENRCLSNTTSTPNDEARSEDSIGNLIVVLISKLLFQSWS
jgi:hypothetical protein